MAQAKQIHTKDWHLAVEQMQKFTVKIKTRYGRGTGFACAAYMDKGINYQCIVTAAHVIEDAKDWNEPFFIENIEKERKLKLMHTKPEETDDLGELEGWRAVTDYSVLCLPDTDTAIIVFDSCKNHLQIPKIFPKQLPAKETLPPGMEIGWLGYPGVGRGNLCFFSGRVSCYEEDLVQYLVDGGAMRGVSGGPAFVILDQPYIIGLIRAQAGVDVEEGETGLCVVEHIEPTQEMIKVVVEQFKHK